MSEYPKINSIFKRDEQTHKFTSEYSRPEFEYLKDNQWIFTEKVNGTNCRVLWNGIGVKFGGKTDNASMPIVLMETLQRLFTHEKLEKVFPLSALDKDIVVLYGEGYGPRIEKGGGLYRKDASFVLFDVKVGPWWLKIPDVADVGKKLDIDVVPVVGQGTLQEAVERVKTGFKSTWGDFLAEGLVLRPLVPLVDRAGNRIITKVKHKDFK